MEIVPNKKPVMAGLLARRTLAGLAADLPESALLACDPEKCYRFSGFITVSEP